MIKPRDIVIMIIEIICGIAICIGAIIIIIYQIELIRIKQKGIDEKVQMFIDEPFEYYNKIKEYEGYRNIGVVLFVSGVIIILLIIVIDYLKEHTMQLDKKRQSNTLMYIKGYENSNSDNNYCSKCGRTINAGDMFCSKCGKKLY